MEQNLKLLMQTFMKYGIYLGAIQIIGMSLFYLSVDPVNSSMGSMFFLYLLFSTLPWVLGLLFLTKRYRDVSLNGFISMPQIVQFSSFIGLFGGFLYVLFQLVYFHYVNNHFLTDLLNTMSIKFVALMEVSQSSQSEIDELVLTFNQLKEVASKGLTITDAIIAPFSNAFWAMVTMFIFGWSVRKLQPIFPQQGNSDELL